MAMRGAGWPGVNVKLRAVPSRGRLGGRNWVPARLKKCASPKSDWTIDDIERACRQLGMVCTPPSSGSHYKVSSLVLDGALTVPARRPIKVFYIKEFLALADAHIHRAKEVEDV